MGNFFRGDGGWGGIDFALVGESAVIGVVEVEGMCVCVKIFRL